MATNPIMYRRPLVRATRRRLTRWQWFVQQVKNWLVVWGFALGFLILGGIIDTL